MMENNKNSNGIWEKTRKEIIGRNSFFDTPFGKRLITYADYTASGRGITFIEDYVSKLMELYGNTHTEDDITGTHTTELLKEAERKIKNAFNAPSDYKIIHEGYGSTGAIHRLQKILGVYIPPVLKEKLQEYTAEYLKEKNNKCYDLMDYICSKRPVVFVSPYEHHSNELTWREGFAEVIEIDINKDGFIDLKDLRRKIARPEYKNRTRIGSFSACSNVTGIKTDVYKIAEILHDNNAYAFFDFSASAPYTKIDIHRNNKAYFDALFFSPHKFIGGPGSCGILLIHEKLYRKDLPPTCSGGGTVAYVGYNDRVYVNDIELREKPGTPGILPLLRASLAIELRDKLGPERIEKREKELCRKAINFLKEIPNIEILGNLNPDNRIPIISFNIKNNNRYLHPKFIVKLLNDLFGIQARAGCSCAGPYGHRLLNIDDEKSKKYREKVKKGLEGLKPGWARISLHYLMTDEEVDFILKSIEFLSEYAKYFLKVYSFNIFTGAWNHVDSKDAKIDFGVEEAFKISNNTGNPYRLSDSEIENLHRYYLREAYTLVSKIKNDFDESRIGETEDDLLSFVYYRE